MCGRYTLIAPFVQVIRRFNTPKHPSDAEYQANYNVAPGQPILCVINDGHENRLGYLRWGLIPSWAKDAKIGYKMINARAETVSTRPAYRAAFKRRRCLIVADSFYEWRHDSHAKNKTPLRFMLKNGELFGMAGLWERWSAPDGQVIYSATIITTKANSIMAPIHDRMPVILRPEDEQKWISSEPAGSEQLSLLQPYESEKMTAYQVSQEVNSPRNNNKHLIQRVEPNE